MKAIRRKRPDAHTVRLALTYLLIIMVMSICFSIVIYRSSVSQIRIQNQGSSSKKSDTDQLALFASTGKKTNSHYKVLASGHVTQAEIANLNKQIQQTLANIRSNELRRLIALNAVVLVLGTGFSYFLARRTLRPIESAMDAQSRFASDASHELRTPLTVMQTANEKALRTLRPSKPMQSVLKSNLDEITQLKGLSESLLRLAHEAERLTLQPVPVDKATTVAIQQVTKRAAANDITIQNKVPRLDAMADEPSLIQVLTILLDNAVTYSPKKSIVRIEGREESNYVYLSVQDTGFGIAPGDLEHIFDRFYRTDQSRKQHPTGHGLGLSIAKKLIKQQHGSITATSVLGVGSTLTIKLAAITAI
jgi:two-component system sensor histidine kinase CiaH